MSHDSLVECAYGWGRVLRLYSDYLDINGTFHDLNDLLHVQPEYRRMLGISSARLDLQFRDQHVVVRGIADVVLAQKVVAYLATWSEATIAMAIEEIRAASVWPMALNFDTAGRVPRARWLSAAAKSSTLLPEKRLVERQTDALTEAFERSYAQNSVEQVLFAAHDPQQQNTPVPAVLEATEAWPWLDERQVQRKQRLKRLQSERERRMYGFDVEALALRLRDEPLPELQVSIRLLPDEMAHYRVEAALCAEPPTADRQQRYRLVDRGELIVSNRRIIYLGRKRQIVLSLERLIQANQVAQTLALLAEHWVRQQYFVMERPLECIMHIERILLHYQYFEHEQAEEHNELFV